MIYYNPDKKHNLNAIKKVNCANFHIMYESKHIEFETDV